MQKIPFKQETKSGCGSHSLANLFNDQRYLEGVDKLEFGEGHMDMNEKLRKFHPDFYLDVVFATCSFFKPPFDTLKDPAIFQIDWTKMSEKIKNEFARVLFLTVKSLNIGRFHCILIVHDFSEDLFYVVDSLNELVCAMKLDQVMELYEIMGIEYLCNWTLDETGSGRECFLEKDFYLNHIIKNP